MCYKTANVICIAMLGLMAPPSANAELVRGAILQDTHKSWEVDNRPTGKGWGEKPPAGQGYAVATGRKKQGANGINYHGGPLILGTTNVYYIWYGNWAGNTATSILPDLATGLSGSPYYNINTTYYNGSSVAVTNATLFKQSVTDNYSHGTALADADVTAVVSNAITSGALPADPNAVYFVLTSADVNETSGFCTSYCGWHTHGSIAGQDIKYSFVGNPDRCPSACEAQTTSPNGNAGADGMASVLAHELEEAVTDPDLNAWYDTLGQENADKCAWKFGTTYTVSNGSQANMKLGARDFLIQQNWLNASGGLCTLAY
ncbi:hypothetical protein CAP31_11885 [Sulfuriferula sp. AH1]|uniref:hypothetical protein n=1 Tax=Sulfuriferula sp. AH1 TaxID=1985873 RepID=UPI000B3B5DE9|nr:hypothetical protein [Sulfuriferula sp. AH1]ARU32313.1 hypothetical protein CAP31_11885 [Sulfuriferula sp. AH1]